MISDPMAGIAHRFNKPVLADLIAYRFDLTNKAMIRDFHGMSPHDKKNRAIAGTIALS
jgi:hypothetical protein